MKTICQTWAITAAIAATCLSGCGKEEFIRQVSEESGSSVGAQAIPAKVDILVVVDNSASFSTPYYTFQQQLSGFVAQLAAQGWDYHIAAIPLATNSSYPTINTVLVNRELNSAYLNSGLPNPSYSADTAVNASNAVYDARFLSMLFSINTTYGSQDFTFRNIVGSLNQDVGTSSSAHFLRPDSLFATIVISNGNDFSSGDVNTWGGQILSASRRSQREKIRFYAVASQSWRSSDCWGSGAAQGDRYFQMAGYFNSPQNYDFCQSNMADVVADIGSNLQIQKRAFSTRAIFLGVAPVTSSIVITKEIPNGRGGFTDQVITANDPVNGWTYSETNQPRTEYSILQPYSLDQRTGYMIELHGTGRITGDEKYRISYQRR